MMALGPVLVICSDARYAYEVLGKLFDAGVNAVGPVSTAAMALAIAAQTSPSLAIVANPPTGRRNAAETARDLMRSFGVRSLILDEARTVVRPRPIFECAWAARSTQVTRLRAILGRSISA